jgi:anti-sigma factor RsiW
MSCSECDALIPAYVDGELDSAEGHAFEQHLSQCECCRDRVTDERKRAFALQAGLAAQQPKAPEHLKARLRAGLDAEMRSQRRRRVAMVSAAAASVCAVVLAGHWQYRNAHRRAYAADAAARHARQYPLEVQPRSVEQLEAWFGGKLDHRVALPRLPNSVATGGRLLNVLEKPAAYVRYDVPNPPRQLGLFVYGDMGDDVAVGEEPAFAQSHGYNVVTWREGDVVYQLVTDLDEPEAQKLLPGVAPSRQPIEAQPASFR